MYSITGQKVLEQSFGSITGTIEMSGLPSGLYIVQIAVVSTSKTVRVIKR